MTFRRGATLPVATSLGHADTSDLGPTAGNGFYKRWPDDLALLSELGLEDLRLTFDWARLQPKPGDFSSAWIERYDDVFGAAEAIGIDVWGALYDGGVPRWFANEGGIDDDEAVGRWWPRWVERVADRFGDRLRGWIPFDVIPTSIADQVWTDTWTILGDGEPDVAASLQAIDGFGFASRRAGEFDVLGVALDAPPGQGATLAESELDGAAERWAQALHDAAEVAPDVPKIVSRFIPHPATPDIGSTIVERLVTVIDDAIADGIDITTCLLEPAIAGPESPLALLDELRTPQPAVDVYLNAPTEDE